MQPADVANVPNPDADGDGVMDLHDSCPSTFDPSQFDEDGDRFGDACDCAPEDASAWALPGEATQLLLTPDPVTSGTMRLDWTAPATGALPATMIYDVIRSTSASDLVNPAICLASNLTVTTTADVELPVPGSAFYYVVREADACGPGVAHVGSDGLPVPAHVCPPKPLAGRSPEWRARVHPG